MKLGCPNTLGILKNIDPNQTARMHIVLGLRCLYLTRDAFSKNYTCFRKKNNIREILPSVILFLRRKQDVLHFLAEFS